MADPHHLARFVEAQSRVLKTVQDELQRGHKTSHWMWFVFPQLRGLGSSSMAEFYGIASLDEAVAFLAHPVLGARLREWVGMMNRHAGRSAAHILGSVDALKFRSSMTLFDRASQHEAVFTEALQTFYGGEPDPRTLALLDGPR